MQPCMQPVLDASPTEVCPAMMMLPPPPGVVISIDCMQHCCRCALCTTDMAAHYTILLACSTGTPPHCLNLQAPSCWS